VSPEITGTIRRRTTIKRTTAIHTVFDFIQILLSIMAFQQRGADLSGRRL
jgi:hypothetical protein